MNQLQPGQGLRPSVEPITTTWATLLAIRDGGNLIPGQFYRITDYVTTSMAVDTRSAGHPFDIIVRADSANVLNEQAWAVQHKGDTYFKDSRLEAWELKYNIDNIQWSQKVGTLVMDESDGYTALSIGTVDIDGETYILWDASAFEEDYGFNRFVSLTKEVGADLLQFDAETGEIVEDGYTTAIAEIIADYSEPGKGSITWMKDEWGNKCAYDFKNIQFKRWKVTDAKERVTLDGRYMGVINDTPEDLSIEDEEDFIWCYTFSSDSAGGEQADYSLGDNSVFGNVFPAMGNGVLNDNVMFGPGCYDNISGFDCTHNTLNKDSAHNIFGDNCYANSWGNNCSNNSCRGCQTTSWGSGCSGNILGTGYSSNSWGNDCKNNSVGNAYSHNYCAQRFSYSTVFDGIQDTQITVDGVRNAQILNGLAGTSSSRLTLNFAANKSYTQVACKNTSGTLVIYVPGDLA